MATQKIPVKENTGNFVCWSFYFPVAKNNLDVYCNICLECIQLFLRNCVSAKTVLHMKQWQIIEIAKDICGGTSQNRVTLGNLKIKLELGPCPLVLAVKVGSSPNMYNLKRQLLMQIA